LFRASALDALAPLKAWWPIVLGLAVLYVPTYWMLAHGIWNSEEQAHGPIVLVVTLFLIWQQRAVFMVTPPLTRGEVVSGWVLVIGLLAYALGRSQDIPLSEVGPQVPVILGALLITPACAARACGLRCSSCVHDPLPGFVVDAATGPPGNTFVIAEQVLYGGYPIAQRCHAHRWPLPLLVAMPARTALHVGPIGHGLLYLYLMQRTSPRVIIIMAAILPIAFAPTSCASWY
jgi:hypothetical protein